MESKLQKRDLVIACLADHPKAMILLRIARNRAAQIGGRWRVVFIETPAQAGLTEGVQERMLRLLTLTAQMGGETLHVTADNYKRAAISVLEEENESIASVIIGDVGRRNIIKFRPSLSEAIVDYAHRKRIAVEMVHIAGQHYRYPLLERFNLFRPVHLFYALLTVGVAYAGAFALQTVLPPALFRINNQNVGLLFMIACAFSASRFGLIPGLIASLASFFIINYCLTVPYYQISLSSVTDLLNMGIFLSAALLISFFNSRSRGFAEKSRKRELNTQVLFNLYQITSDTSSRQQALERLQEHLARTLKMEIGFFLPPTMSPDSIEPVFPATTLLSDTDAKALELCWKEMKTTGLCSPSFRDSAWRFNPMLASGGAIGVIGVKPRSSKQIDVWFGNLLMTIADQVATIIEHIELASTMEASRISEEREKLRSMLLSSVSHDLRTPLASIVAALNIYRSHSAHLDAKKRDSLIETAISESERLDSFITNILDMTRLEGKKIKFTRNWHDPSVILRDVVKRLEYRLRNHHITIHPAEEKIEVLMDQVMIGQVLQNIIDNACKYTPSGTLIEINMIRSAGSFTLEVRDHGGGIPPDKMEQIFDKYARLHRRDSQVAGTGLGLAICKSMMEGQGGVIKAANHQAGGAIFILSLPEWRNAPTA